jgi:hypothetical protein
MLPDNAPPVGEMVVTDVTEGLDGVAADHIKQLRIVQIFPKTTNLADNRRSVLRREENGRAVLGHRAGRTGRIGPLPGARPQAAVFQALDDEGGTPTRRCVRSPICSGRAGLVRRLSRAQTSAPPRTARNRWPCSGLPSQLDPGPWGGRPFSYVEVVQPVLDQHCVRCHGGEKTEANFD